MSWFHYCLFLVCLLLLDIAGLYGHFFYREMKTFEHLENKTVTPSLPLAFPVQIALYFVGAAALYFLSPDKTFLEQVHFPEYLGLTVLCGAFGLFPSRKAFTGFLRVSGELAVLAGFVFLLPENDLFKKINLPDIQARLVVTAVWFGIFKVMQALNRFDGIIAVETFYTGFASILMMLLAPAVIIPFLQINASLCFLMFMLTPFCYIFRYTLPLNGACANMLNMIVTGTALIVAITGYWGIGLLIISYVLFEIAVFCYRGLKNLVLRKKIPLLFISALLDRGASAEIIILSIVRYQLFISGLILFAAYAPDVQVQPVALAVFLYFKLYLNVVSPTSAKASLADLYKEAKKDAKENFKQTSQTFTDLKERYFDKGNNQNER